MHSSKLFSHIPFSDLDLKALTEIVNLQTDVQAPHPARSFSLTHSKSIMCWQLFELQGFIFVSYSSKLKLMWLYFAGRERERENVLWL